MKKSAISCSETGRGLTRLYAIKSTHFLIVPLLALLLLTTPAWADLSGKVVAVTDGDTIKVLDAYNTEHKVRLTGIDAPEKSQPYGNASRKHL